MSSGGWILENGARVTENQLVFSFEDFVGDPSGTIDRLSAAAAHAVAGKLLYDDEAGERLQIPAGAVGIGEPLAGDEHPEEVRFEGAWTFASDDDARHALEVLAAALVRHPPRSLSTKHAVLRVSFDGHGPSRTVDAVKRALFAIAPAVVSGKMRHQRRYGGVTDLDAPFRALDDGAGERRFVRYVGRAKFRNERARDGAFSSVSTFGAVTKGKQKIVVNVEGTIAAARLPALNAALDATIAAAVDGEIIVDTAERRRVLEPPSAS